MHAIISAPQHALSAVALTDNGWTQFAKSAPQPRRAADWRELLIDSEIDAVIVAGHSQDILDGARALARERKTLIVIPDVRQSSSFAYDLWPAEDEGRTRLIPLFRHDATNDKAVVQDKLQAASVGSLKFIQLERTLPPGENGLLPLAAVENALLHDADFLRAIGGDYARVTCVPVGRTPRSLAMMTITLTGNDVPETTWRIAAASTSAAAKLTITGESETLTLDLADECDALPELGDNLNTPNKQPRWTSVVRAFDVVDAARRSIRRQRTVEIGSQAISEQRQFKSLMTAAGCGVLLYTMFAVVAALLIGVAADPRDAAQKRSAASGFILHENEFTGSSAELSSDGQAHVEDIAARLWTTTAEVLIEASPDPDTEPLGQQRRATVEHALHEAGASDLAGRVVTRPLSGLWFEKLMVAVWTIVFAPLVILLATQLLGLAARPDK